ncbi:MAG: hypothetical protein ACKO2L_22835 [Planctomycetaceae bacterium]
MDSASLDSLTLPPSPAPAAVSVPAARSLPLPLSEFEEYMLCDDRPTHPMVIVMLADVTGLLHEAEFRTSVAALLRRQLLLRCRIQIHNGRPAWLPLTEIPDPVVWHCVASADPAMSVPTVQPLDIRSGQGLRVTVWFTPTASRISLELHHACADGIAAVQLLNEMFAEYAARTGGAVLPPPPSDAAAFQALETRSPLQKSQAPDNNSTTRSTPLHILVAKLARLLGRRPVRIADSLARQQSRPNAVMQLQPSSPDGHVGDPFPAISVQSVPDGLLTKLRSIAATKAVGLNDLLLLQMFRHVTNWNTEAGLGSERSWVRIAVPVSMRNPRNGQLPACNLVSYALVTHRMRDCREPSRLLQQIHEKTATMRSGKDGLIALKIFRLLRRIPWGVRAFLSLWPCAGTLVLANVGHVSRRCRFQLPLTHGRWTAGNIIVERVCGAPPVRPHTLAAFGITEYAGQLHISLRTDGTRLNAADTDLFLRQFISGLRQFAEEDL